MHWIAKMRQTDKPSKFAHVGTEFRKDSCCDRSQARKLHSLLYATIKYEHGVGPKVSKPSMGAPQQLWDHDREIRLCAPLHLCVIRALAVTSNLSRHTCTKSWSAGAWKDFSIFAFFAYAKRGEETPHGPPRHRKNPEHPWAQNIQNIPKYFLNLSIAIRPNQHFPTW